MERDKQRTLRRNLYGRSRHRRLSPTRRSALAEWGPRVQIPGVSVVDNPERKLLPPESLAGTLQERWLEIGFGTGEHLLALAQSHPEIAMIGAEPYLPGVSRLLSMALPVIPANLRVHAGDARDLLDVLPDDFLARVFLLFPDPWPKRRHTRRRFVSSSNLDALARVMRPKSELRIATDIHQLARHCLIETRRHPAFVWTAQCAADWRLPWSGWPGTRYEEKAILAGRCPVYLTFSRTDATYRMETT